ncbi:S-layer homology domain-containing protein [Candidatus Saganbacteria bacterium]|nr:S-layer homology domain-containing protein [Candidatus Saganbacteria bacterium]
MKNTNKIFVIAFVICSAIGGSFVIGAANAAFDANDPSGRSPNARVLALGRAFTALADDPAAIYFNPAGLAGQNFWQLSSMSGKFVDDYNYLSLMGTYPTNFGVVGIGYGGYNIGGAVPTTIEAGSDPRDPTYIADPTQPQMSNYNNVFTLAYGSKLDKFLGRYFSWVDKIDFGLSLKLFSVGLSGDHIINGSATGQELDAGIMYRPHPAARLGAELSNLLPSSMGGKLSYVSGHTEYYPAVVKLGGALKIVGAENALRSWQKQEISAAADYELHPTTSSYPGLFHLGVEWSPLSLLSVRIGIDQSPADDGNAKYVAVSNMTFGVGVHYSNFKFDYAYHQFAGLPIDNSYFSLAYSPAIKKPEIKDKLIISGPKDKSVVFDDSVKVSGQVKDLSMALLQINNNKIDFKKSGSFEAEAALGPGKNKIGIQLFGEKGKLSKPATEESIRVLKLTAFPDVPEGYWARQQVSLISMLNIVTGYPDGSFKPEGNITRAEMAALLMRSSSDVSQLTGSPVKFKDVKRNHWASKFILDAAAVKIVEGYTDRTFRPNGNITRAEGLAMIARFANISLEPYSYSYFPDIASTHWASSIIAGSFKAGILEYLKGKAFEPKRTLTRAEAVEILYRTEYAKGVLNKDLLNWDTY